MVQVYNRDFLSGMLFFNFFAVFIKFLILRIVDLYRAGCAGGMIFCCAVCIARMGGAKFRQCRITAAANTSTRITGPISTDEKAII